jgi:hypothetical protein
MNRKQERELLVFTYLIDNGLRTVSEIRTEFGMPEDEDFQFENTANDLVKEGYLEPKSMEIQADSHETSEWELTEKGKAYLKDLAREKYDERNKIPVYIWAVIIVAAILTFIKLFPRMFH